MDDFLDVVLLSRFYLDFNPDFTPDFAPDLTPDLTPELTPGLTLDLTPDMTPDFTPDLTPGLTPDLTPGSTTHSITYVIYIMWKLRPCKFHQLFNVNEGLGVLKLADTVSILINPSPSNVNYANSNEKTYYPLRTLYAIGPCKSRKKVK